MHALRESCICLQGYIQHATINNLAFGRNVEETLRILQAIQYVQENPDEVCCFLACLALVPCTDTSPLLRASVRELLLMRLFKQLHIIAPVMLSHLGCRSPRRI